MSNRFEGSFKSFDQSEIFFQYWSSTSPRGTIVITHGLAEHSECYHNFAKNLTTDGWECYALDLRGHGRSEGKRGFVRDFKDYVQDLNAFLKVIGDRRANKDQPLILFGHSMGGLISTLALLDGSPVPVQALTLSAPEYGIAVPVPAIKDYAAKVAIKWLPSITLHNEIKYSDLTRDESILKSYDQDTLRHDKISPAVYLGMLSGFQRVHDECNRLQIPILMQLAGIDRIVSTPAAQEIFSHLTTKRKVLEVYPESRHEIYNDLDRDQAMSDLKKFINQIPGAHT